MIFIVQYSNCYTEVNKTVDRRENVFANTGYYLT